MDALERIPKQVYFSEDMQLDASEKRLTENFAPHWHEFYELEYVLSGSGVYEVNGTPYPFSPGSAFLMTPVDFHAVWVDGEAAIVNVMFAEPWLDESLIYCLLRAAGPLVAHMPADRREGLASLCRAVVREYKSDAPHRERVIKNLLECAVVTLLRELEIAPGDRAPQPGNNIQHALTYIQTHFREPITLGDAAAQAGLSATYFSEKFHAYAGETFRSYLVRLRCEYAQRMLAYTDVPVTEVCYACGFATLSHFQRTFKSLYGMSPRAWRAEKSAI